MAAGPLADEEGADGAGGRRLRRRIGCRIGGSEFEGEDLFFAGGGAGDGVEQALLGGFAECWEAVERGQAGGGEVDAAGLGAGAGAVEDDAVAELGRDHPGTAFEAGMVDGRGDGGVVEGDVDSAEEDERAASGEDACVEGASEVFGREGAEHAVRVGPIGLPGEQGPWARGGPAEEGRDTPKGGYAATAQ